MAQEPEDSPYQRKSIGDDHNLGIAVANSTEGGHCAFSQDTKAAACTPDLGMESALAGDPVQTSEVQGTASSKAAVLPTHPVPSHPSSDRIRNTNPVQPVQGTCSVGAGKAGANHPVC